MTTLKATIKGRRLELDIPADWPDGTEVEIHPLEQGPDNDADVMSPEEIATTLAAMAKVEPFDWSDAERAAWEAERQARKNVEKSQFVEHAEELRRIWE
jgi:hypothetical protein